MRKFKFEPLVWLRGVIMDQFELEERHLQEEYENGNLSLREFNHEMLELQRDYQGAAEEAAQDAYDRELDRW